MIENTRPIFIGGAGRSGTTLFRTMLDSHPHIACGSELKALPMLCQNFKHMETLPAMRDWGLSGPAFEAPWRRFFLELMEPYRQLRGKPRVAEKTPNNAAYFDVLGRLFPKSPLIHVVRDGRDVVASLLQQKWVDTATGRPMDYCTDPIAGARYWGFIVASARRHAAHLPYYYEVRYEALVRKPEETMGTLLRFMGETWDASLLDYGSRVHTFGAGEAEVRPVLDESAIGRWEQDLTEDQKVAVMELLGPLLKEFGYLH